MTRREFSHELRTLMARACDDRGEAWVAQRLKIDLPAFFATRAVQAIDPTALVEGLFRLIEKRSRRCG